MLIRKVVTMPRRPIQAFMEIYTGSCRYHKFLIILKFHQNSLTQLYIKSFISNKMPCASIPKRKQSPSSSDRGRDRTRRALGYERVYLPLCEVADTPFHIQGDEFREDLA